MIPHFFEPGPPSRIEKIDAGGSLDPSFFRARSTIQDRTNRCWRKSGPLIFSSQVPRIEQIDAGRGLEGGLDRRITTRTRRIEEEGLYEVHVGPVVQDKKSTSLSHVQGVHSSVHVLVSEEDPRFRHVLSDTRRIEEGPPADGEGPGTRKRRGGRGGRMEDPRWREARRWREVREVRKKGEGGGGGRGRGSHPRAATMGPPRLRRPRRISQHTSPRRPTGCLRCPPL